MGSHFSGTLSPSHMQAPPMPPGPVGVQDEDDLLVALGASSQTSARVKKIMGHGAVAAGALASGGASAARVVATGGAALAQQAAVAMQQSAGLSTEYVELLGLAFGGLTGLCCLCTLYCLWRYYSQPSRQYSRVGRARRAIAKRGHRALPTADYSDDEAPLYGY